MNLDSCTPGQRESVMRVDGPLLVSAGAGSGKTFTLTRRIVHALESGAVDDIGRQLSEQLDRSVFTMLNETISDYA